MITLSEKASRSVLERREDINIHFARFFLKEEAEMNKGPLDHRFIVTERGRKEIFDVSFSSAEILMVQHLKMPFCSLKEFNSRFAKKGIRIEKIEK